MPRRGTRLIPLEMRQRWRIVWPAPSRGTPGLRHREAACTRYHCYVNTTTYFLLHLLQPCALQPDKILLCRSLTEAAAIVLSAHNTTPFALRHTFYTQLHPLELQSRLQPPTLPSLGLLFFRLCLRSCHQASPRPLRVTFDSSRKTNTGFSGINSFTPP